MKLGSSGVPTNMLCNTALTHWMVDQFCLKTINHTITKDTKILQFLYLCTNHYFGPGLDIFLVTCIICIFLNIGTYDKIKVVIYMLEWCTFSLHLLTYYVLGKFLLVEYQ